ncbi:hypothetical protein [Actinokineospora xionganensis]|uniref:CdiA C-terminal tRNase domain-containing protein n=1 Tax=Actinokineospora xionganensis TaxID=2684470 RepID=A0ABR7LGF0_9PSEU|nr:hypothetical protein [Actinokineospora xionganensis]MBC6451730.1 hypothetical protein [Actinokineospora xionganensis]
MSIQDLVAGLTQVIEGSEALRVRLSAAVTRFEQAQHAFARATRGSNSAHPPLVVAALGSAGEFVSQAVGLLAGMENYLAMYVRGVADPGVIAGLAERAARGAGDGTERDWRLGYDPASQRYRQGESLTARRVEGQRHTVLVRSSKTKGPDWIGPDGKTYDAVGPFAGKYFDRQWEIFQGRILDHMNKADWVPVDVSQFTPEQVARVREFIGPLGPRVFIVGE